MNYMAELQLILAQEGPKGMYRGFWATFYRDVPFLGVYFMLFRYFKNKGEAMTKGLKNTY